MRTSIVIAAVCFAACRGNQVDGGPCTYEAVRGPCMIVSAQAHGEDYVQVLARTADGFELRDMVPVPKGQQATYVERVSSMSQVQCGGQRIVSGTCSPHEFSLALPRPSAEELEPKRRPEHEGPQPGHQ